MIHAYLHWLYVSWTTPLSGEQKLELALGFTIPVLTVIVIGKVVFDWWFEEYYNK